MDLDKLVDELETNRPTDKPPTSRKGELLGFVFLFTGLVASLYFWTLLWFLLGMTATLFIFMLDSGRRMNYRLRKYGRIEADYFVGLAAGVSIVAINMFLVTMVIYPTRFPTNFIIPVMTAVLYLYTLLTVIEFGLDTEEIHVKKDPENPTDRYYVFTEEEYIPLLEETAKQKSETSDGD